MRGVCEKLWVLTAVDVLTVPVLTGQAASLVAQSIQLARRQLRLVLETAEVAVLAVAAEVPMVAHLLSDLFHAGFERVCRSRVFWWERFIEPLLSFVVISIFLLRVLLSGGTSRCDRNFAVRRNACLANCSLGDVSMVS